LTRQQHGRRLAIAPDFGIGIIANGAGARHEDDLVLETEHDISPMNELAGT
jgi:hypothetical protein